MSVQDGAADQRELWMGPRLVLILGYFFQRSRVGVGHVDAKVVAVAMGVTAGTVRRWIRTKFPVRRMAALEALVLPSTAALEQDRRDLQYARSAVEEINDDTRAINPSWTEERWLEPHTLGIVRFTHLGVCVARISRSGGEKKTSDRVRAGDGVVIEGFLFGNRFSAQVAKGELLEALYPWRIVLPQGLLPRGRTQAWMLDAPIPELPWMALTRVSSRRS